MSIEVTTNTINRIHVVTSSLDFLLNQVKNQRLHVANLLAKTGDKNSYAYLQEVLNELEVTLSEFKEDVIEELKS